MPTLTGIDGFEHGLTAASPAGPYNNVSGSPAISTGTVRTGARSLQLNAPGGTQYRVGYTIAAGNRRVTQSFYINFSSLPAADAMLAHFVTTTAANGQLWYDQSANQFAVGFGSVATAGGPTLSTATWYRIDIEEDSSTGTFTLKCKVDGGTEFSTTQAATAEDITGVRLGSTTAGHTFNVFYDDWVWSVTGGDYPIGAHSVEALRPTADGTHNVSGANQIEDSATGTDYTNASTTVYQVVDDNPLSATLTDYINDVGTGTTDYVEVTFSDLASGTDTPIDVNVKAFDRDSTGTGTSSAISRVLLSDSTAVSPDVRLSTDDPGVTMTIRNKVFTRPTGNWDRTKVNGLKARFGFGDGAPDVYFESMMLEVAMQPASGTTVTANQTTETDTAQTFAAKLKVKVIGINAVTETAQTFAGKSKVKAIGQATETDTSQTFAAKLKVQIAFQVTETSTAQPVTQGTTFVNALQATETDTSQALTRKKVRTLGLVTGTETAQVVTKTRSAPVTLVTETQTSQALTRAKTKLIGQATETSTAQVVTAAGAKTITLGLVGDFSSIPGALSIYIDAEYTFDGGVQGTAVTTSDTGSGNPWDGAFTGTDGINIYESLAKARGSFGGSLTGGASSTAPFYRWEVNEQTDTYYRMYVKLPALPSANRQIWRVRTNTSLLKAAIRQKSDGAIALIDAAGLTIGTSTKAFAANEQYRMEWHVVHHATTGSLTVRLFYGANLHGTTPDETITATNQNTTQTGTGTDQMDFGWLSANIGETIYLDAIAYDLQNWVGPAGSTTTIAVSQATETETAWTVTRAADAASTYAWESGQLYGGGGINCITPDPTGNGRWVAGGDNNGPKWTENDGVLWAQGYDGMVEDTIGQDMQTIAVEWSKNPSTPDRVWRASKYNLFVSDDAGKSWTEVNATFGFQHEGARPRVVGHLLHDDGAGHLYCAEYSGAISRWNYNANGISGSRVVVGNVNANPRGISIHPTDNTILFVAAANGLWQVEGINGGAGTATLRKFTGGTGEPAVLTPQNAPQRCTEECIAINEGGTIRVYVAAYNSGVLRINAAAAGSGNIANNWTNVTPPAAADNWTWCSIDAYRSSGTTKIVVGNDGSQVVGNGYGQVWYSDDSGATYTCLTADNASFDFINEMGGAGGDPWWGYGLRPNPTPKEKAANRWIEKPSTVEQILFHPTNRNFIIGAGQQGCWSFNLSTNICYPWMAGMHCGVESYVAIDPDDPEHLYVSNSDHIGHHTKVAGRGGDWRKNENGNPDLNGETTYLPVAPDNGTTPTSWFTGFGTRFLPKTNNVPNYNAALGDVYWHDDPGDGSNWQTLDWNTTFTSKRPIGLAVRRIGGLIHVLAAAQGGGIAKRVFNPGNPPSGGTWEYKNTTAMTNSMTDSRAVPLWWATDTNAYLFDPDSGLWRSTNAGETWTKIWSDPRGGERDGYMVVDPDNPNNLYMSLGVSSPSINRGVWKITNAHTGTIDATPSKVTELFKPGGVSFIRPTDIGINTGGRIVVGDVGEDNTLTSSAYYSTDYGATFIDVTDNFFRRSIKKSFSVAMGSDGKVWFTSNGGGIVVGVPQSVSGGTTYVQLGLATETDLAQAIQVLVDQSVLIGQATETDTVTAIGAPLFNKLINIATALDSQTANAIIVVAGGRRRKPPKKPRRKAMVTSR